MWVLEVVDTLADHSLDQYGIEPRDADGLVGIVAAPFLHAGFDHLVSNTVPFVVMGLAIALQGVARVAAVTVIVALVSGLGTWLIAPEDTIHIGASGIVFGYASYLLSRGFFNRDLLELAMGAVVGVIYGGALLGGLVPEDGVSWQGHFFGAVGGVIAARMLARDSSLKRRMVEARLKGSGCSHALSKRERARLAEQLREVEVATGRASRRPRASSPTSSSSSRRAPRRSSAGGKHLTDLGPGDFLGEIGLVRQPIGPPPVIATAPITALVMDGEILLRDDAVDADGRPPAGGRHRGAARPRPAVWR